MATSIEWTRGADGSPGMTWNPVVGCTHLSPGCDHCYAATVASRQMQPAHVGLTVGRKWNDTVRLLPERLDEPLKWRKPRKVFVGSMTDLFHRDVPTEFILDVWATMARCPQHTFQILTKRPQRMCEIVNRMCWHEGDPTPSGPYLSDGYDVEPDEYPPTSGELELANGWLGTSIENDRYTWRADHLRNTWAAVRFLSAEPLLGPLPSLNLTDIDWVIVGGESGPGARPMHPDWVRDIRDRCVDAGVAFHFKQWGAWVAEDQAPAGTALTSSFDEESCTWRLGKHAAGRLLDGRTWDEYPT